MLYAASTGEVVNHRNFDSFGALVSETNAAKDYLFGYTGKAFDEPTGLQNNLNRWYDPAVGRWLSEDPIGFAAGDANLSRYVGNAVTGAVDPSGLELRDEGMDWPSFSDWWEYTNPLDGGNESLDPDIQAGVNAGYCAAAVGTGGAAGAWATGAAIAGGLGAVGSGVVGGAVGGGVGGAIGGIQNGTPIKGGLTGAVLGGVTGGVLGKVGRFPVPNTSRAACHLGLRQKGFEYHSTTRGGYVRYRHPNGSEVHIRPGGQVLRLGPKVTPQGGGKQYHRRVDASGKVTGDHNPGEYVDPLPIY